MNEDFISRILAIVAEIPKGKVATYGQIAFLAGFEKNSRLVGKVLALSSCYGNYACHRVVNHQGRLVPGWKEQKKLLAKEKVEFLKNGNVNLKKYQWKV